MRLQAGFRAGEKAFQQADAVQGVIVPAAVQGVKAGLCQAIKESFLFRAGRDLLDEHRALAELAAVPGLRCPS